MANCGTFLEYAGEKCGVDVGYGKLILIYPSKQDVAVSGLTSDAINTAIEAGEIIGVIKGWHTVVGAPVAEVSVERIATSEMKLIREEVAADTLTFERNLVNREVLADLVKAGTLQALLVDDLGNVFGDKAQADGEIGTMALNFSSKVTNAMQSDNNTDKTIAIAVRYLVKDLDFAATEIEPEMVVVKTLLKAYLADVDTLTSTSCIFDLQLKQKANNKLFDGTIEAANVTVTGANITTKTVAYVAATGILTITLAGVGFAVPDQKLNVAISADECYMKEAVISMGE